MKIIINGDIIDTKDIYKITKLREISSLGTTDAFIFEIISFNNKTISITIDGDNLFPRKKGSLWNDWYRENYDVKFKLLKDKATEFRESIIKIWSENQSNIPQFNLDNYENNV